MQAAADHCWFTRVVEFPGHRVQRGVGSDGVGRVLYVPTLQAVHVLGAAGVEPYPDAQYVQLAWETLVAVDVLVPGGHWTQGGRPTVSLLGWLNQPKGQGWQELPPWPAAQTVQLSAETALASSVLRPSPHEWQGSFAPPGLHSPLSHGRQLLVALRTPYPGRHTG